MLAGDTSLIDPARAKKIKQLMNTVLSLAFLNRPNDLAVAVESINAVPGTRMPAFRRVPIACDHLSYFHDAASVAALKQALGIA